MKIEMKITDPVTGCKINPADYPEEIRKRLTETHGKYLLIGKPEEGHTCHHVFPYASCRVFWNEALDNNNMEDHDYYLELACDRENNIVELPRGFHKSLHKAFDSKFGRLYSKDNEGRKYVAMDDMPRYLIEMLNTCNRIYRKQQSHYNDLHLYLKEYALKIVNFLGDNSEVMKLVDDLASMTHAFSISEQVRYLVSKLRRVYL